MWSVTSQRSCDENQHCIAYREVPADWGSTYLGDKQTFVSLLSELHAAFMAEVSKAQQCLFGQACGNHLLQLTYVPALLMALKST